MKTIHSRRSGSAFTLIELLVVISIIAILAGLTLSGTQTAMLSAKRVSAKNDMSQIAMGVTSYYTEYGRYPQPVASATTDALAIYGVGTQGNNTIIDILRCTTSWFTNTDSKAASPQNPRQIQFLQPKVVTAADTVATKSAVNSSSGKWYDPWGTQYIVFIDADYAGDIGAGSIFTDITTNPSFGVGVASVGYYYVKNKKTQPDALTTPRAFSSITDLLSWQ
ncbi:MAG: type II secretion system protein [Verrucomicrobiota bacterium]